MNDDETKVEGEEEVPATEETPVEEVPEGMEPETEEEKAE